MEALNLNEIINLEGISLVEASAGTGKTFSITKLVLQAVLVKEISIEKILVVTFTEAATKELRSRIRAEFHDFEKYVSDDDPSKERIEEYEIIIENAEPKNDKPKLLKNVQLALLNIDQAPIFTIHGFCQRMLNENTFESKINFGAELLTDTNELVKEIAENFWRKNLVNITEEEQELFSDIKFDKIHNLTGNFIGYNNVELVNASEKSLDEIKEKLKSLDIEKLKKEMLEFFKEYSNNLNRKYSTENYEATVNKLTLKNIRNFSYDEVERNVKTKNKKKVIDLPHANFFDEIDELKDLIFAPAAIYKRLYDYTKEEIERIKEERNILTFDDLIQKLRNVIADESKTPDEQPLTELIRAKYHLAFVDEFQDTDKTQYKIFKHIFGESDGHGLFLIGDPKQSIYKFRGADIYSYLQAKADAKAEYTLQNNYRSEKGMIEAVNSLFRFKDKLIDEEIEKLPEESAEIKGEILEKTKNNIFACPTEHTKAKIDFVPAKFPDGSNKETLKNIEPSENLQLWTVNGYNANFIERNICQNIAAEIINLMKKDESPYFDGEEKKQLSFKDFAILVNTHKQATEIKRALSKSNIPAVIQNTAKIYESRQAEEIKLWLKAILKPTERNIRSLFVTDLLLKSAEELEEISNKEIFDLAEQFILLSQGVNNYGIYAAFTSFVNKYGVMEHALKKQDGERIVTNYFHIINLLHQNELKAGRNVEKALNFLEFEMQSGEVNDEKQEQLESDKKAVKIMTIHKAKGLEFPIVFCPFIWNNAITKYESYQKTLLFNEFKDGKNVQKLDLGARKNILEENKKLNRKDVLAEHVRLLYVALTRAKSRCYLIFGNNNKLAQSVFAYMFTTKSKKFVDELSGGGVSVRLKELHQEINNNIKTFKEKDSPLIHFEEKSRIENPATFTINDDEETKEKLVLSCKKAGNLSQKWGVGSFTSLVSSVPYENDNPKTGEGIFELPGGKFFGTAIHKICENYFNEGEKIFTNKILRKTMFENVLKVEPYFRNNDPAVSEKRFDTVKQMIDNNLNSGIKVNDCEIKLRDISPCDARPEFSFYYKVNKISPKLLKALFVNFIAEQKLSYFKTQLEKLDFSLKKGYLTGEIDLLFRKNNKYFVLDWKTNNLGDSITDYAPDNIENNMAKHLYLLQAHIYTLATHLFLKQTLENYNYDKDFGGFIYVYTRGVDKNGNGMYFNKPRFEFIEKLEKEICGK